MAVVALAIGCRQNSTMELDETKAREFIGKTVLIGITDLDRDERILGRRQFFGTITEITAKKGIVVTSHKNGSFVVIPPILSTLQPAEPGVYHLKSTGENIANPDFLTTWDFKKGDPKNATGEWHQ